MQSPGTRRDQTRAVSEKGGTFQINIKVPKKVESRIEGNGVHAVNGKEGFPRQGYLAEDLFH